jgi:hypothetical protein
MFDEGVTQGVRVNEVNQRTGASDSAGWRDGPPVTLAVLWQLTNTAGYGASITNQDLPSAGIVTGTSIE